MQLKRFCQLLAVLAFVGVAASAQNTEHVKMAYRSALPNVEGKSIVAVVVSYPPGAKSAAHHHAPSSFIYAYVLSGSIRSQVGEEPVKVYRTGESFTERPGSYHRVSENASTTEPASLLALFVVDSNDSVLTIPDTSDDDSGHGKEEK